MDVTYRSVLFTTVTALLAASTDHVQAQIRDTTLSRRQGDATIAEVTPLDPIVVTATRVPLHAVTAAATVLTGTDLRARGITHVLDALRNVPGLTVARAGSFGAQTSLYLRGGERGYVRVLVDGVPINDPGGDFDFGMLTTENIDRIEIVRGPASVLYGSDAVTGVIQIFTRRGEGEPRLSATARGGTFATRQFALGLEGGNADVHYGFEAGSYRTDGIYAFNSGNARTSLNGNVVLSPDADTDARLTLQYGENDVHVPTDGSGNVVDRNAHQTLRRVTAGFEVGRRIGSRIDARLMIASSDADGAFDDGQDGPADTLGFFAYQSLDHVQRRSADVRVDATLSTGIIATAGFGFEQQKQRSFNRSQSEFGSDDGSFEAKRGNHAVYAQLAGDRRRFGWQVGVRVDDNDAFGGFATVRGGVVWRPDAATRIRASAGNAFREPTFLQNYAQGFAVGNPDLRPERTRSFDIGVTRELLDRRVRIGATVFDQRFRDLIEYTFTTEPGASNYFNIASATSRGLELEADLTLRDDLAVRAGYTRLRTRVLDAGFDTTATGYFRPGASLLRRPAHSATAGLVWRPLAAIRLHGGLRWTGERDDLDFASFSRVTLPAYSTVDTGIAVTINRRFDAPLSITADVSNVLDETWEEVRGYRAPGRMIVLGLRVGR